MTRVHLAAAVVALALFVYLVVALLRPEVLE